MGCEKRLVSGDFYIVVQGGGVLPEQALQAETREVV
jgi:hypothetical protein